MDASTDSLTFPARGASMSVTGAAVFNGAVTLADASTYSITVKGVTTVNDGLTVIRLAEFVWELGDQATDIITVGVRHWRDRFSATFTSSEDGLLSNQTDHGACVCAVPACL